MHGGTRDEKAATGAALFCIRKLLTIIREHHGKLDAGIPNMWNMLALSAVAAVLVVLGILDAAVQPSFWFL
jgi:hypothetical protein